MSYETFAADLLANDPVRMDSVEEADESIKSLGFNYELRQHEKGAFRSDRAQCLVGGIGMLSQRFSRAFLTELEPPTGTVGLFLSTSPGTEILSSGLDAANDKIVVLPDGVGTDIVSKGILGTEAIILPQTRFLEIMEAVSPGSTFGRMNQPALLSRNGRRLRGFRQLILDLVTDAESDRLEEEVTNLTAEIVACLGEGFTQGGGGITPFNGAKRRIARRAQEYLEDRYKDRVHTEDMCRELGVGVRTLQRYFREYFQVSPSCYLKMLRYNKVRRALGNGDPARHFVTDIALDHGLNHLGRFSVEYRELFCESPNETLARRIPQRLTGWHGIVRRG